VAAATGRLHCPMGMKTEDAPWTSTGSHFFFYCVHAPYYLHTDAEGWLAGWPVTVFDGEPRTIRGGARTARDRHLGAGGRPPSVPAQKLYTLSHRMFGNMHGVLNIN
jgi:hypothetical protein